MAKSFELQMKEFENMTAEKSEKLFRKVCFDLSSSIIRDIPVDEGRAKGSFFPEINQISNEENGEKDTDKSGRKSISKVKSKTNSLQLGNYFSLTSNLDYIATLEFGLYPNPVKNILNLSYTKDISNVAVFKLLGQEVIAKSLNANQGQIDMSNLANGAYFVKITADNQVKTIKVIKE